MNVMLGTTRHKQNKSALYDRRNKYWTCLIYYPCYTHVSHLNIIAGGFVLLSSILSSSLYRLIDLYPFNTGSIIGKQQMGHVSKIKLFWQTLCKRMGRSYETILYLVFMACKHDVAVLRTPSIDVSSTR